MKAKKRGCDGLVIGNTYRGYGAYKALTDHVMIDRSDKERLVEVTFQRRSRGNPEPLLDGDVKKLQRMWKRRSKG